MSSYKKIREAREYHTNSLIRHIKEKQRAKAAYRESQKSDLEIDADAILRAHPKNPNQRKGRKSKSFSPNPNKPRSFYSSWEWKKVRMMALQRDGHRCGSCGASPKDGIRIVVDHIKPLGKFWELRLSLDNLQVLCDDCNRGKGDWLQEDFRSHDEWEDEADPLMAEYREIMR